MSKFFDWKLYLQGLKKSRVVGFAILITTAVLSALPSFLEMLFSGDEWYNKAREGKIIWEASLTESFSYGLVLVLLLAPLLTLNIFRYLNQRNESDFYHSIPFTRPCVFFSFVAAALTWLFATVAITMTAILLFRLATPGAVINLAALLIQTGLYWLALTMITAFTALAMTVTGTGISNLFAFYTLFFTFRIVGALFLLTVKQLAPLWIDTIGIAKMLSITFSLPLALLLSPTLIPIDWTLILYTLVLTALLLAAGCYFYTRRKSEMAGKSAPAKYWQHIFRCMACLPLLCGIVTLIVTDATFSIFDPIILALIVLLLLTYYLYEIITTKQLKNCLSATPYLAILLAFGILFGVGAHLVSSSILLYTPDAEDIRSVERHYSFYDSPTYEDLIANNYASDDPEIKALVAKLLREDTAYIRQHGTRMYQTKIYSANVRLKFLITSDAGITRGRYLMLSHEENELYWSRLRADEGYKKLWLSMPSAKQIDYYSLHGHLNGVHVYHSDISESELWKRVLEDYQRLSEAEKIEFKLNPVAPTDDSNSRLRISIQGYIDGERFYSTYTISPDRFPTAYQYAVDHVTTSNEG